MTHLAAAGRANPLIDKRILETAFFLLVVIGGVVITTGCGGKSTPTADTATAAPTVEEHLPGITAVNLDRLELPRYESLEMVVDLEAKYANPYDAREVRLDGTFSGPDGAEMAIPGFWDGDEAWKMRFTPSQDGEWHYRLVVTDSRGAGPEVEGTFMVTPSELHGWLQPGDWFDSDYSGHYLVYHDGTPFYGLGHCDALNIFTDGFDIDRGVLLFDNMAEVGENFVVWWPQYASSPVKSSYERYSVADMETIDLVVEDAQAKDIFLVFTIWDHPQLRDENHSWGTGNWENNGFSELSEIDDFFTSDEVWAWQENLYRYIIARWGYSPAIGMWQTVSEINGTNSFDQTDQWHTKVNDYFVENDPYRHPTTASMSGDTDWPAGHLTMDAPQVHIYDLENDAVKAAETVAQWTELMWNRVDKPNWIGEFGVGGNSYYPELFHNSLWAALASGAAMTPAEWNSPGYWGRMTPEMDADITRLAQFVAETPLAEWNPAPLQISTDQPFVRGWGVAGQDGGLFWVQDFSLEGSPIEDVREAAISRQGVAVDILGLAGGSYTVTPFDTWDGRYLPPVDIDCLDGEACEIESPEFMADMAFRINRK